MPVSHIVCISLSSALLLLMSSSGSGTTTDREYTNEFAVNLHQPASSRGPVSQDMDQLADQVAKQHGFVNRGQIGSLDSHYLFEHSNLRQRSSEVAKQQLQSLQKDQRVRWVEQQYIKSRRRGDEL